jgi:hypothetical protein
MDERESGWQPLEDIATGCRLVFVPAGRLEPLPLYPIKEEGGWIWVGVQGGSCDPNPAADRRTPQRARLPPGP